MKIALVIIVLKRDFVVVKMDVEGTELKLLIESLVEVGAICLID